MTSKNNAPKVDEVADGIVITTTSEEHISSDELSSDEVDNSFKAKAKRLVTNKKVIATIGATSALIAAGAVFVIKRSAKTEDETPVENVIES